MKKCAIIGAGVSGMALGIHLLRRGWSVEIFDSHVRPGGLCASWTRGGYDLGASLHWVLGARPGSSFHKMWSEVVDIDSLEWLTFRERLRVEVPDADGGSWHFSLLNDVDEMEAYLQALAPEDRELVGEWMDAVRFVVRHLPELPPVFDEPTLWGRMLHGMRLMNLAPMLPFMFRWGRQTTHTFAARLKNGRLASALRRLYVTETPMTVVIFGQAYMASGAAAYPVGGARALVSLLAESFTRNGGEWHLGKPVASVSEDNGRATGLMLADGARVVADAVASTADWRWTMTEALGGRHMSDAQRRLAASPAEAYFFSYCRVLMGVRADLSHLPHFLRVACDVTLPCGTHFEQMEVEVNHFDKTLAPEGCTAVAVNFPVRSGDWWIGLRDGNSAEYRSAKEKIREMVLAIIGDCAYEFPIGKIDVVDVVTPATFARYAHTTFGSTQGWAPQSNQLRRLPVKPTVDGLEAFVMAGQWLEAGGGLPVALATARRAAGILGSGD